jgi:hypothetical protein
VRIFVACWVILLAKFPNPAQPLRLVEDAYDADLE